MNTENSDRILNRSNIGELADTVEPVYNCCLWTRQFWLIHTGGCYKVAMTSINGYRISSYESPSFYFLPSIFGPACKRMGPLLETRRIFWIGPTNAQCLIKFEWR